MAIQFQEIKKSTAARKDVRPLDGYVPKRNGVVTSAGSNPAPQIANDVATEEGTQAPPVETIPKPKRGRPKTGFDKLAYNRQFSKDKRAATKLGISVKEFRANKEVKV